MLILSVLGCVMLAGSVPAELPSGWTCEGPRHDAWVCKNREFADFTVNIGTSNEWTAGHAAAQCGVPGIAWCGRSRVVIGTWAVDELSFRLGDTYHYVLVNGPREEDAVQTWRMADALFPQVRIHAVEEVCQRETGKPCEVTFGPMELQPNGDPRALQ
jgi:hypothetical protein